MDMEATPTLRGFDSYEIRLGDELRGHRATMGKSLLDVQRDLRIKASYVDAIENCDASVVPNKGFVPGYVRAYARYLGLDADAVYARFCEESGFVGQTTRAARPGAAPSGGFRLGGAALARSAGAAARDPALSRSHFATPVGRARPVGLGVSLSDVASVAVLGALIIGLGYGGWALVQDIQRVEFAPSNEAPEMAQAPDNVALPGLAVQAAPSSWPGYAPGEREQALAELYAPQEPEPPAIALRDGPIASIDPARSGLYGDPVTAPPVEVATAPAADTGPHPEGAPTAEGQETRIASAGERLPLPGLSVSPAGDAEASGVWLVATAPAWVQVKGGDGTILVQRIMEGGERWRTPSDAPRARLRAGNAGGVMLEVDGVLHGPLGPSGAVVKNIPLEAEAITRDWPRVTASADVPALEQRAEAETSVD